MEFWHQQAFESYQDTLGVYYRTGASQPWILLAQYTEDLPVWTRETLALPAAAGTYQLGFLGIARSGGNGVALDDVTVTATAKVPGDANQDRAVTFEDFAILQNHYGRSGGWADGDFNGDGQVTFGDFAMLQNHYGHVEPGGGF